MKFKKHAKQVKPLTAETSIAETFLSLRACREILLPNFDARAMAQYIHLPEQQIINIEAGRLDDPIEINGEQIKIYPTQMHAIRAYIAGLAWAANIPLPGTEEPPQTDYIPYQRRQH